MRGGAGWGWKSSVKSWCLATFGFLKRTVLNWDSSGTSSKHGSSPLLNCSRLSSISFTQAQPKPNFYVKNRSQADRCNLSLIARRRTEVLSHQFPLASSHSGHRERRNVRRSAPYIPPVPAACRAGRLLGSIPSRFTTHKLGH